VDGKDLRLWMPIIAKRIRKIFVAGGLACLLSGAVTPFPALAQDLRITLNDRERSTTSARGGGGDPTAAMTTVTHTQLFRSGSSGDSLFADAVPLSNVSFYIQVKRTGFTNVSIYDSKAKTSRRRLMCGVEAMTSNIEVLSGLLCLTSDIVS